MLLGAEYGSTIGIDCKSTMKTGELNLSQEMRKQAPSLL